MKTTDLKANIFILIVGPFLLACAMSLAVAIIGFILNVAIMLGGQAFIPEPSIILTAVYSSMKLLFSMAPFLSLALIVNHKKKTKRAKR